MNDLHATERFSDRRNRGHVRCEHGPRLGVDALKGRLMSSSYAPPTGHPNHEPMLAALRDLFDACTSDGRIRFDHDTRIHVGTVN